MKSIRGNIPTIIFWIAAAFILLWYIGARGLCGPEDRWAEVVREMRIMGDYFHPRINGMPYFDKLLLSYGFIALAAAVTGSEKKMAHLIVMSVIILGGYLDWQDVMVDKYRSMKPFSTELKAQNEGLKPANIAFFRKYAGEILFYMNLSEPVLLIKNTEKLNDFLNSEAKTKLLISNGDYNKELLAALPEWVPQQPTLKEKMYPWEKKEKYEAWIIQNEPK